MDTPIRVLYVDDHAHDRALVEDALRADSGFDIIQAGTRTQFETILAANDFDIVLTDFDILGYTGLQVLEAVKAKDLAMPVILLTGTGSEEIVLSALRQGAADYIVKTPANILRLPHAIRAALARVRLEARHREDATRLKLLERCTDAATSGIVVIDAQRPGRPVVFANPAFERITGYNSDEVLGHSINMMHAGLPGNEKAIKALALAEAEGLDCCVVLKNRKKNGEIFWNELCVSPVLDDTGRRSHFVGVINDVTERTEMLQRAEEHQEELERKVAERTAMLKASNEAMRGFSYTVSHDLRAPLRAVIGFSTELKNLAFEKLDGEERDFLSRVIAAANRMNDLIESLIDLSRISQAEMLVRKVDLSAMALEILGQLKSETLDRVVQIEIAPGGFVYGDPRLLHDLMQNLLSNAWKYTSRVLDARIQFDVEEERNGMSVFAVRDNGAGFDMRHADKLFKPFQRLHPAADYPGSGIGLATVKRIVQRHGGRIWVESAPDEGACFWFELPESPPVAP